MPHEHCAYVADAAGVAERGRFLPTTRDDLAARGWDGIDILIVTGDAYVDHPSFGPVLIARFLEAAGYRVGLVAQPSWETPEAVSRLGRPRLFAGVSAGNLDSMLNKLTAQKKLRSEELYSPGGRPFLRPNRATIVYANLCRQAFPGLPIVLGGIEASLRRVAHYDYWSDQVRRSILLDAKADLLVFGMGETAVLEIASRLHEREPVASIRNVRGTGHVLSRAEWAAETQSASGSSSENRPVVLPSFEEVATNKPAFAQMTRQVYEESSASHGRPLIQAHGDQTVFLNPPAEPLPEAALDALYDLPFQWRPHPDYEEPVPAYRTIEHSVAVSRGCFGGCAFCSITCHEGRSVQSRSMASVLRQVRRLKRLPEFRGVLTDVGGPTANMYGLGCGNEQAERVCRRLSCLHPTPCSQLRTDHTPYRNLLRALRSEPGVRRAFIASGIRHDLALLSPAFIRDLAHYHTGGQLSIAPEHVAPGVLAAMRKPSVEVYERFQAAFQRETLLATKQQFLVPYFIVGHPGSTLQNTVELAQYLKARNIRPRQVQEFIPTPMTLSTAMYHTGIDPISSMPVEVVRDLRTKRMMKALLLYWDETSWPLAREALARAGRNDLIGKLVPGKAVRERDRARTLETERGRKGGKGTRPLRRGR